MAGSSIIVMGVCACGKSTIGELLAKQTGENSLMAMIFIRVPIFRKWPPASRSMMKIVNLG